MVQLKRPLTVFSHPVLFLQLSYLCLPNSFWLNVVGGNYQVKEPSILNEWFHVVMIYNGPEAALRVRINGDLTTTDTLRDKMTERNPNSGRVLIGKRHLKHTGRYCSAMVDELRLGNRSLTVEEGEHLIALY